MKPGYIHSEVWVFIVGTKAGTINRIIDKLIDKFHKNDYRYRFANNRSFNFYVSYLTVFTLSVQTSQLLTILNLKFNKYNLLPNVASKIAE